MPILFSFVTHFRISVSGMYFFVPRRPLGLHWKPHGNLLCKLIDSICMRWICLENICEFTWRLWTSICALNFYRFDFVGIVVNNYLETVTISFCDDWWTLGTWCSVAIIGRGWALSGFRRQGECRLRGRLKCFGKHFGVWLLSFMI